MAIAGVTKYSKLDTTFKTKWLKALRSGRYRQATRALRRQLDNEKLPSYCCVGVACNIYNPKKWERSGYQFNWDGAPASGIVDLPFLDAETFEELSELNDDKDWTFSQIADWIEENL